METVRNKTMLALVRAAVRTGVLSLEQVGGISGEQMRAGRQAVQTALANDDLVSAADILYVLFRLNARDPQTYILAALVAWRAGHLNRADGFLSAAIELDGGCALAWLYRGELWLEFSLGVRAVLFLKMGMRLAERDPVLLLHHQRAQRLLEEGLGRLHTQQENNP